MINGTNSHIMASKNKYIVATQSSLDKYIADRIKSSDGKFKPIDQTKQIDKATHSHFITKAGTQSFRESIKPEDFSVVKSIGTHSFSEHKATKGITHSHPTLQYTKQTINFKTQSVNNSFGLEMESGKISYNNPNLIKVTHSNSYAWITNPVKSVKINSNTHSNAMIHMSKITAISTTHSSTMSSIKMPKLGLNFSTVSGTASMLNKAKRFYAKTDNSTQKLDAKSFTQFVSELSDNSEMMIKTKNVTVNGIVITSATFSLTSGDVVRVGNGHYINGSKQVAIVK